MANRKFVSLLRKAADAYEIKEVKWKPRAYRRAARGIESLQRPLKEIYEDEGKKGLEEIPGVGSGIAEHVIEYLENGEVEKWQKLFKEVPEGTIKLLKLEGLGPAKVKILHDELGIESIEDLEKAVKNKKVRELEGFGEKTEKNILKAISTFSSSEGRMLVIKALPLAESIVDYLREETDLEKIRYAGSLRRMKETIGDIDILAVSKNPGEAMGAFAKMPDASRVIARGETKSSIMLEDGIRIDLRVVPAESYGPALLYFTGSKQHNVDLRKLAIRNGYKLSEYGLFRKKDDKKITCKTEKDVYRKLGLDYIPPEIREARGEIDAASEGSLPKLVEIGDIKGDLHTHTNYSDGIETVEDMIRAAEERGYEYFAVTDHSPSAGIAHGLSKKRLKEQWEEIDKLSDKYDIKVLKGAEIDILKDGSLDYPDEILEQLHIAVCAVHSKFKMSKKQMTKRVCTALENEYLDILGHPSGRMIGKREAISLDFEGVFEVAEENGKVMEINSQPKRLDLKDTNIKMAKEYDLKFSIGTDSHAAGQLDFMEFGVGMARRGWLTRKEVVNTFTFSKLRKQFSRIPKGL
ncbi:DNA polymerase/3'-5' exonuclease PolX [Candidatus Micrarchaeota archaeon]|nr:DNA polymerase/3'-5' exonuclease PolX [Candidatus Micrarchaeota archaeon]